MSSFKTIRVGDRVVWRGAWGTEEPKIATIEGLVVTDEPGGKYGESAEEVDMNLFNENRVIFDLDSGHWAYSYQVKHFSRPETWIEITNEKEVAND